MKDYINHYGIVRGIIAYFQDVTCKQNDDEIQPWNNTLTELIEELQNKDKIQQK